MDFTKFVNLLEKKALWFSVATQFDDPFEGTFTNAFKKKLQWPAGGDVVERNIKTFYNIQEFYRRNHFINCWHINEVESEAMWRLYTSSSEAVAIQSTCEKLIKCFDTLGEIPVTVGTVAYVDYDTFEFPDMSPYQPFLHKRTSFKHEQELRAITHPRIDLTDSKLQGFGIQKFIDDWKNHKVELGKNIPVNLSRLIERIYIAPGAQPWFKDLVRSVAEKYGNEKPIEHSKLDEKPAFS